MVEQWDTEEFRDDTAFADDAFANWDAPSCVAAGPDPHLVPHRRLHRRRHRSRQHTRTNIGSSRRCAGSHATGLAAMRPADSALPDGLTPSRLREAYRALKGPDAAQSKSYAADGNRRPIGNPYTVTEQQFRVRRLQPTGPNRHAVFFVHAAREHLASLRARADRPARHRMRLTLETDPYGDVLRAVSRSGTRGAAASHRREPALDAADQGMLAYDQAACTCVGTAASLHQRHRRRRQPARRLPRAACRLRPTSRRSPASPPAAELRRGQPVSPSRNSTARWQQVCGRRRTIFPTKRFRSRRRRSGQPGASADAALHRPDAHAAIAATISTAPAARLVSSIRWRCPARATGAALTPGLLAAVFGALAPAARPGRRRIRAAARRDATGGPPPAASSSRQATATRPAQELAYAQAHFFLPLRAASIRSAASTAGRLRRLRPARRVRPPTRSATSPPRVNDYRVLAAQPGDRPQRQSRRRRLRHARPGGGDRGHGQDDRDSSAIR